jgi:hypothetical protein
VIARPTNRDQRSAPHTDRLFAVRTGSETRPLEQQHRHPEVQQTGDDTDHLIRTPRHANPPLPMPYDSRTPGSLGVRPGRPRRQSPGQFRGHSSGCGTSLSRSGPRARRMPAASLAQQVSRATRSDLLPGLMGVNRYVPRDQRSLLAAQPRQGAPHLPMAPAEEIASAVKPTELAVPGDCRRLRSDRDELVESCVVHAMGVSRGIACRGVTPHCEAGLLPPGLVAGSSIGRAKGLCQADDSSSPQHSRRMASRVLG